MTVRQAPLDSAQGAPGEVDRGAQGHAERRRGVRPAGLRTRLTLAYAGLFAAVLTVFAVFTYRTLAVRAQSDLDDEIEALSTGLSGYVRLGAQGAQLVYDPDDPEQTSFVHRATRYFQVYDLETGALLLESRELEALGLHSSRDELQVLASRGGFDDVLGEHTRLRFHTLRLGDPSHGQDVLRVGMSMDSLHTVLARYVTILAMAVPAGVLLAAWGGWWMAGLALRPVRALQSAAHDISISRLDRRLPLRGSHDELDQLASTFNGVFGRLQDSVGQMRQYTTAISHELRTPLLVLRGEAELALLRAADPEEYRRVLASQLEEFDRLTRLVNQLLTLAQADAGEIRLEKKEVDVGALVRRTCEDLLPVAEEKGIVLEAGPPADGVVLGDEQWLERLVLNLLDNALKYTGEGGHVRASVRQEAEYTVVEVEDTGIGIPRDAVPHVFDRFYRAAESRRTGAAGVGIGLALVRWITEAHGGTVGLTSEVGQGSRFTVLLPHTQERTASSSILNSGS